MKNLKTVYGAVSKDVAFTELDRLDTKGRKRYPIVIKSWRDNWDRLTEYLQYTQAIRKLIYNNQYCRRVSSQIRKVTKNKDVFTSDTALEKLVSLAYRNMREKWTMPLANWSPISQQLAISLEIDLKLCNFAI